MVCNLVLYEQLFFTFLNMLGISLSEEEVGVVNGMNALATEVLHLGMDAAVGRVDAASSV